MAIQDKFNKTGVIYKITSEIDLGGGALTIPRGCTLDFQGGCIKNGTVNGNGCLIQGDASKCTATFNNVKYFNEGQQNALDAIVVDVDNRMDAFTNDTNARIDAFESEVNGSISTIQATANNASSKADSAVSTANAATSTANQAATTATTAKNAVATLEGLANTTTAQETLAGQVVQIEENKQNISELSSEVEEVKYKPLVYNLTYRNGLVLKGNAVGTSSFDGFSASDYISIEGAYKIAYKNTYAIQGANIFAGFVLYNEDKNSIVYVGGGSGEVLLSNYPSAKYFRFGIGIETPLDMCEVDVYVKEEYQSLSELTKHANLIDGKIHGTSSPCMHNMECYNIVHNIGGGNGAVGMNAITTSSYLQATTSGIINKIRLYAAKAGGFEIVVGKLSEYGNSFRHYYYTLESKGVQELNVTIPIEKGEYVGYGYTGDNNLPYSLSSYVKSSKFIQFDDFGVIVNRDGFVSLQYSVVPVGVSANAYSSNIKLGSEIGIFQEGTADFIADSLIEIPQGRWYTFIKDDTVFSGIIKKIRVYSEIAQDIVFGIGLIDQRNWAIIDEEFTLQVNSGNDWTECNIYLQEGKRLFIKGGVSLYGITGSSIRNNGSGLLTESENSIYLERYDLINFSYEIEGEKHTFSNVAKKSDIQETTESLSKVESRLNTLNLDSLFIYSSGKAFKLSVDSNGNLGTILVPSKKITIFGNSIEIHGYADYWWSNDRGMASSTKDKDYPHRIQNMLTNEYSTPTSISVYNIAEWETRDNSWSMNKLDEYLDDTNLVIIRVGENATYDNTYESRVKELITYIKSKTDAPIIWGGLFWANANKDNAAKAAVQSFGDIPFVTFSDLYQPQYKSYIGAKVLGNDGVWHTVNHSGVANHPGDDGFRVIAERFMPYVLERLL